MTGPIRCIGGKRQVAMPRMTIVLAWLDDDVAIVRQRRADLGERPETRPVKIAKACIWILDGTQDDVAAALAYADRYKMDPTTRVYTMPVTTVDPQAEGRRLRLAAYVSPEAMRLAIMDALVAAQGRGMTRATLTARLRARVPEVDEALVDAQLTWLSGRAYTETFHLGGAEHVRRTEDGRQALQSLRAAAAS